MSASERVYLDSSVLISYSSKKHEFWSFATNFLGRVQHGDYLGIVSTLALMESVTGIREVLVRQGVRDSTKWDAAVRNFLQELYKIKNLEFIDGTPEKPSEGESWPMADILFGGFAIMMQYQGKAVDRRKERRSSMPSLEYDGLYAPDAMHIVLAKKASCSRLATFDADFKESRKEIPPIVLNEIGR